MLTAKCNHVHFLSFVRLTDVSVVGFCLVPESNAPESNAPESNVLGRRGPSDRPGFLGVLCVAVWAIDVTLGFCRGQVAGLYRR